MIGPGHQHSFLWLDLETTGINPRKCRILEVAAVLANDGRDGDMQPVWQSSAVVPQFGDDWLSEMDPFVIDMHIRNGLIDECRSAVDGLPSLADIEGQLIELVVAHGATARSVVLAGSTVAFDQSFLVHHMPWFSLYLSHRCFDVSTLKMAERDWAGEAFKKAEAHRALPDVLESLAHAAEIRARVPRWNPCP